MDVHDADEADRPEIRDIAERSFQASYSLSPEQIATLIDHDFADEALADRIEDPDALVLVAESPSDDGVLGFADVELGDGGVLRWLHVDPEARGQGVGTALVERVQEELADRGGAALTARVLEDAVEGGEFLERFGLRQSDSSRYEFDGESFVERVYTEGESEHDANEPAVEVPERVDVDGDERPVDREEAIPGAQAPFFRIYASDARDQNYGYFCSNCGSTDVSADGLDRLECGNCGNEHLADEWDAAYL